MPRQCRRQLLAVEPAGAQDAVIEGARGIVTLQLATERDTQEGLAQVRGLPEVDADDFAWDERPAGFLERLARDGLLQGFAVLEVTGGLVQHHPAARAFLDQQELAVAFDDGGHGDVRLPYHARHYNEPGPRQQSTAVARISGWTRLPAQTSSK